MTLNQLMNEEFLIKYPDTLIIPDGDGYMPFHRATVFYNAELMKLILSRGFDVNTRTCTPVEETSLHLAARTGIIKNLKLVLDSGGDLTLLDRDGADIMHHAVADRTGRTVHYLASVIGMSYKSCDYQGRSVLMKCAGNGNIDVTKYLLRNERSDIMARDKNGNCVLHMITTKPEYSHIAWLLVETEPRLLDIRNCENKTALDYIPANEKRWDFTRKALTQRQNVESANMDWYLYAYTPPLLYTFIYCINTFLITNVIWMAVFILLCYIFTIKQHHRIINHRRKKNPLFYSLFMTGLVGSAIQTWIKFSHLYISFGHSWVLVLVSLSHLYSIYIMHCFNQALPKPVTKSAMDNFTKREFNIDDIAKGILDSNNFCINCEITHSNDVQHCRMCDCCIKGLDHHCIFMYCCISRKNYRLFAIVLFLVLLNGLLVISLFIGVMFLKQVHKERWYDIFSYLYQEINMFSLSILLGTIQVFFMNIGILVDISTEKGKKFRPSCMTAMKNIKQIFFNYVSNDSDDDYIDLLKRREQSV